jgi:hypothetical protein
VSSTGLEQDEDNAHQPPARDRRVGEDGSPFYVGNNRAPMRISREGKLYIGIYDFDFSEQFRIPSASLSITDPRIVGFRAG